MAKHQDYTRPEDVISPKRSWTLIKVLMDKGEGNYSLALGQWDGAARLAMRWNGWRENPLGTPQVRGYPTWFILPEDLNEPIIAKLSAEQKTLVRNFIACPSGKS